MNASSPRPQGTAAPLAGVRVLEFGHIASGPFAGMLLGDMGADVVKIEGPNGDQMRQWPPLTEKDGEQFSHNFASINRNKRSVYADLKSEEGKALVRRLIASADVVLENYRPGVLDRLGFGFEAVSKDHHGLVYASVSGFGQTGAYAEFGAYDVVIQAMGGLMSVTGHAGDPVKAGTPVADFISGLYAALGISSWLPHVRVTQASVHLDVPMLDCLIATSALQTSEFLGTGIDPVPLGTAHPRNAPYQMYRARDGVFVLAAGNDGLWRRVCAAVDLLHLADDDRFARQQDRIKNQSELEEILNERFSHGSMAEWMKRLRDEGVPCGPINTFSQVLEDPALEASGFIRPMEIPVIGESLTTAFPVRSSGGAAVLDKSPPRLGEHTIEVTRDWLHRNA